MTTQQTQQEGHHAPELTPRLSLAGVIKSETLKARVYRKVYILGGLAVVVMGLMGAFAASVALEGGAPAQSSEAIAGIPAAGSAPAAFLLAFAAIGLITDEYQTQTINLSLTVVPHRRVLVVAKYAVTTALCIAVATVGIVAAVAAAVPFLPTDLLLDALGGSAFWVNVVSAFCVFVVVSSIGLAAGFVFRRSLGAGAALTLLLVAVPTFGATASALHWPFLPTVISLTPGPLIYGATSTTTTGSLSPIAAMALLVIWAIAAVATAMTAFRQR